VLQQLTAQVEVDCVGRAQYIVANEVLVIGGVAVTVQGIKATSKFRRQLTVGSGEHEPD
jgi:hypothetical protein